ncbi:MAG: insulinase family protein [Acidimicrobiaceae bacterium]|nr:insulinase family protein [Acidimicrobiaceae bacterium]MCY3609841.1 insulinase family protein [Acidimicrobiaceae bacterium]
MKPALWRSLLATLFATALLTAACAPDEPDAVSDPEAADDETVEVHTDEPEAVEADAEPEETDESEPADEPETADEPEPADETVAEPIGDPIDLGDFNDYAPGDPDATPLPVDPDVVIGELANGLTYYVRSNDSPGKSIMMHLVVNAGAVLDPDGAEGAAHFLEHMMFNGTERFSKNELLQVLRDFGTDFGPDLNAYTSPDETVYILDFKLDHPGAIGLGFTVLSEWASAATLLPADVDAERGIVLDEYRLRDESASGRISNFLDAIYYSGTVYEGMLIGGSEESNLSMTAQDLRDFYDTWYRPDNMAVVVVGDLPVSEMETLVEHYFAELAPRTPTTPPQPDRSAFIADFVDESVTDVVTHPDHGPIYISLDWQLPAWPAGTVGGERLRFMENLIADMLDIRLDAAFRAGQLSQATEPHFSAFPAARGLRLYGTNYHGPDLNQATTDYISVVHGAAHFGFTQAEFDQAVSAIRTALEFQLESEETRQDREFSFGYAAHFLSGADISSTEARVARLSALLDSYSVGELTAHLRWLLEIAPPLVVSIGPDPADVPTAEELRAAVDAAVPLAPPEAQEAIDTLMARPDPAAPTAERSLGLFDEAYEWAFPNGATVVFVPSDIAAGEVNVVAESLGGWSSLSVGDSALVRHAVGAVASSGVGDATATQLDEYLATTTARVSPFIGQYSEGFSGAAGADDLEALFALMHLYVTEPRITEVAVNEQIQAMQTRLANAETFPQWISELALLDALYQGSPWYQFIATQDQIDATAGESLLGLYQARLSDVDDLLVAVVGDIDRAAVADLAARYIGTLPAGPDDTFTDHNPGFPAEVQRITIPVEADSGAAGLDIVFGAPTELTTRNLVLADVASAVIDDLLIGRVREQLGDTYSVGASVSPDDATGRWTARISATGPSEGLEASHAAIIETVAELIANGPTDRDLQQAISVTRDNYVLESNSAIINPLLRRHHADDGNVGTPEQRRAVLEQITAVEVQEHIALWFNLDNRIEVFRSEQ